MEKHNCWIKKILTHLGLIILAAVLFAGSFPNPVFIHGFPFLTWFAYIPILVVIKKYNILTCAAWGAIYGLTAYALFNYWLGTFHPIAGTIVYSIYLIYLAVVFVFLKLAGILFPKRSYLVQWTIWLAYEYLRTKGFLGYSYGITGYSQWQMIPLIQIASITGVWGVSALVTFPSFWLAGGIQKDISPKNINNERKPAAAQNRTKDFKTFLFSLRTFAANILFILSRREKIPAIIWVIALAATLIFGFINMKDFSDYPSAQITLIQHNTDPWEASKAPPWQVIEAYRRDLTALIRLSNEALVSQHEQGLPKPQLVVWPETAFIPRIYWHTTYRDDQNSWGVVRELLEYLSVQDVPFLIGNDDARMDRAKNPDPSQRFRVDYNAAMLFEKGVNTATYRKLHLVPFTEHFPYKKQFPRFYAWLEKADTHFWEKGDEETVFNVPGFTFSAPICFEDTFGYLSRNFVRRGADVLVNLSNDAWSNSLSAQYQHLSMAVFRTVENYRPMVRSTTSGQTCAIDPVGRIIAMAPAFQETWLNVTVPLVKKDSFYTRFGDYVGLFFTFAAVILLLYGALWCTIKQKGLGGKEKNNTGSGKPRLPSKKQKNRGQTP
jgi:apolipoprotein N-acyltransferase